MLAGEKQRPYLFNVLQTVTDERQSGVAICPLQKDIFNALRSTGLGNAKAVILGRDPYHEPRQAHGLAFSIRPGTTIPLSLLNMYKELESTIPGFTRPSCGYLGSQVCQDVLLFSTVLTAYAGQTHSHASLGWETFTDKVISPVNQHREGMVFLLWRSHAQEKEAITDKQHHHVLKASHPSPFSAHRGFFGYNHFVLASRWSEQHGGTSADWMPVLPAESE